MEYKGEIKKLIGEIEEKFLSGNPVEQKWTERDQQKLNQKLNLIAEKLDVFSITGNNEEDNIRNDLTIIDAETGEKINLVNIENMKKRVKDTLKTNNIFSLLRCLAISNKCAHKCDQNYIGLQDRIENVRKMKRGLRKPIKSSLDFNMDSISNNDFEKLMEALGKSKIKKEAIISICRTLGIDVTDIKSDEEKLEDIFYELQCQKKTIVDKYEKQLIAKANVEEECRKNLFWIKDQLISMVGQLLVNDKKYQKLNYEMIECGTDDFKNMLAIDYDVLSYYIEVHMPNFIAEELVEKHKLKEPVKSEERTFEALGATAVFDRDDAEIEEIRKGHLDNARKRILSRPKKDTSIAKTYKFITKKIQNKEDVGVLEKNLRTEISSTEKQLEYSKIRSDEKGIDLEAKIIADQLDDIFRKKDFLALTDVSKKQEFFESFKAFARKEVIEGEKFDRVYFMYANDKSENDFIKLIDYEKEISKMYKSEGRQDDIVGMIGFIEKEVPKFEKVVKKYRKYREEIDVEQQGGGNGYGER